MTQATLCPDLAATKADTMQKDTLTTTGRPQMTYAMTLLRRLGLLAPKADTTEVFQNRLTRIGTREARRDVRACVFLRNPL